MFGQLADPNGANNPLSQVLYGLALRYAFVSLVIVQYVLIQIGTAGAAPKTRHKLFPTYQPQRQIQLPSNLRHCALA